MRCVAGFDSGSVFYGDTAVRLRSRTCRLGCCGTFREWGRSWSRQLNGLLLRRVHPRRTHRKSASPLARREYAGLAALSINGIQAARVSGGLAR
jgi:hypothetical protein